MDLPCVTTDYTVNELTKKADTPSIGSGVYEYFK